MVTEREEFFPSHSARKRQIGLVTLSLDYNILSTLTYDFPQARGTNPKAHEEHISNIKESSK